MQSPSPQPHRMSAASSCCTDLREMNEAKVANILSYLDDVCPPPPTSPYPDLRTSLDDLRHVPSCGKHLFPSADAAVWGPAPAQALATASVASNLSALTTENHVYAGIKGKIDALRNTCDALQRENASLQARLQEERKKHERHATKLMETAKTELDDVLVQLRQSNRAHSEAMSRVSGENAALLRAVEELTHKLKMETSAREAERQSLEGAHAAAISQLKGKWAVQEKALREKWKEKELRTMKQATLAALQPDIEMLMKRHKAEKARLDDEHQEELRRRDKILADKEAAFEELKSRIQSAADSRSAQERQLAEERAREECHQMRRVMEEERVLNEKKREAQQAVFDEKERLLRADVSKLEQELFEMRRKNLEGTAQFRDAVSAEVSRLGSTQDEHLRAARERLEEDFRVQKARLQEENSKYLAAREDEIRSRCKMDMDNQIAQIHEKLEDAYLKKVREMKEGDRMIRDKLSRQERQLEQLQHELELVNAQLKTAVETLRQRDDTIAALHRDLKSSRDELETCRSASEQEFEQRLKLLDRQWQHKIRQLETEKVDSVEQLRHEHRKAEQAWELLRMQLENDLRMLDQRHNTELTGISDRVLVTVATKDGVIKQLNERISQLEAILRDKDAVLEQHRALLES